ncbi:MFS transporter [Kibdelosporangium philippinense]|uniref:MFS transporter n=1 Tax=Kibdelosporangium philippinense TaxID=211113 RepID=A0ABS8ZJ48_9PSEU|nr:MFS transporter [Kibdelosporangium philippinense]MCE7007816.1 MFS transporter [Kibdelosporangium philippinense]
MRRDLGLIVTGVGISMFGASLTRLVLLVQLKDDGALAVSAAMIAWILPAALGAPIAGLLVDRLPNRRLMQAAQLLQALSSLGMAFALDSVIAILVLTLLVGCGSAISDPTAATLAPRAAGEGDVAKGFAWLASARSAGLVLGTGTGGLLLELVGARQAILLNTAAFLIQALLLLLLRVDRDPRVEHGSVRREKGAAMAGIRHLKGDRIIVISIGGLAVVATCVTLINVADVFLILDVLHGGPVLVGWIYATWMVGQVLGARTAGRFVTQRAMIRTLSWAGVTLGLAIFMPAVFAYTAVMLIAFLFGGFANGMQMVARQALVRMRTPEHLHGRAFAANDSVIRLAGVLGTLIGGFAVTGVGPQWAMGTAGVAAALVGVATLLATREREPARVAEATRAG